MLRILHRRCRRWLNGRSEAYQEWRLRRRRERRERIEEERQRVIEDQAHVAALARATLKQLDASYVDALRAELRAELLDECREEALQLARQELEESFARRRERLQDEYAAYKDALDMEVEERVERGIAQSREELLSEVNDRLEDLRTSRHEARTQRDAAEAQLTALIKQLFAGRQKTYLYNAGIRELDLHGLNQVLARAGLRVRSQKTYSERLVKTRIAEAHYDARSLFWLDSAIQGVIEDDAPEDVTMTEGSPTV